MKKVLLFTALCALLAGCASSTTNKNGSSASFDKYQIVDQEFDSLLVPNDSYDRVAPYEEQVSGASYIQSINRGASSNKPVRKMTGKKVVVDGKGNELPANASAPVTDQEALPDDNDGE